MLSGAQKGSFLGPRLFNIYIHGIFMILKTTYFTGYANDSLPFVVGHDTTDALKIFENGFQLTG